MATRTIRLAVTLAGAGLAAIVVAAPGSAAPATSGGGCATDPGQGITACIGPGRHSGHLEGDGRGTISGATMWTNIVQVGSQQVIAVAQGSVVDAVPPGPGQYVTNYYCTSGCDGVTSPVINYP